MKLSHGLITMNQNSIILKWETNLESYFMIQFQKKLN